MPMAFLNLPFSVVSDAALLALQPLQLLLLLSRLGTARIASLLSVTRGARGRGDVAAEQAQEREAMAEVRQAVRDAAAMTVRLAVKACLLLLLCSVWLFVCETALPEPLEPLSMGASSTVPAEHGAESLAWA